MDPTYNMLSNKYCIHILFFNPANQYFLVQYLIRLFPRQFCFRGCNKHVCLFLTKFNVLLKQQQDIQVTLLAGKHTHLPKEKEQEACRDRQPEKDQRRNQLHRCKCRPALSSSLTSDSSLVQTLLHGSSVYSTPTLTDHVIKYTCNPILYSSSAINSLSDKAETVRKVIILLCMICTGLHYIKRDFQCFGPLISVERLVQLHHLCLSNKVASGNDVIA